MHMRKSGFTLIELMVTVAIVAILSSLAYAGYQAQIKKTRAAQLREAVLSAATQLEAGLIANNRYPTAAAPLYGEYFTYSYTTDENGTNFSLSGQSSTYKVWAGVNSAGTRCFCTECTAPSSFSAAEKTCQSPTTAF